MIGVCTENGKGKSIRSFGLAIRGFGHGLKVYIIQFMKNGIGYGEIESLSKFLLEIKVTCFG